jgi:hypothetical protein
MILKSSRLPVNILSQIFYYKTQDYGKKYILKNILFHQFCLSCGRLFSKFIYLKFNCRTKQLQNKELAGAKCAKNKI